MREHLGIVVHEDDRVAVGHEVVHDPGQSLQVGRVQTDGRLVQHVQHARGAVAHRPGQLDALPLAGGERGGGAVEAEVAQAEVDQALGRVLERLADAFGHRPHRLRERGGHAVHPGDQLVEGHLAGVREGDAAQARSAGGIRQARAAAIGAGILPQELLHAFHAFLVGDFGEGVLDAVNGAVVGEVHFGEAVGLLILIDDVPLLGRAVVDDLLLLRGQVPEGDVRAHAHLARDILHQGPHQRAPGGHGAFVDGQGFVGHQRGLVHGPDRAGAAALLAGALAVEGQFLGTGGIEMRPAHGADQFLLGGHGEAGLEVVAVGAAVAGQAGEHQAQAVEQFGHRAEGAPDAGHARALVQRQRGRHVAHLVHLGPAGLRHPPAGIGGQGLQITAGALGVQHAQGERRLPRARHAGDADDLPERDVDVYVLEIVRAGPAHLDMVRTLLRLHPAKIRILSLFAASRFGTSCCLFAPSPFSLLPSSIAIQVDQVHFEEVYQVHRPCHRTPSEPGWPDQVHPTESDQVHLALLGIGPGPPGIARNWPGPLRPSLYGGPLPAHRLLRGSDRIRSTSPFFECCALPTHKLFLALTGPGPL